MVKKRLFKFRTLDKKNFMQLNRKKKDKNGSWDDLRYLNYISKISLLIYYIDNNKIYIINLFLLNIIIIIILNYNILFNYIICYIIVSLYYNN